MTAADPQPPPQTEPRPSRLGWWIAAVVAIIVIGLGAVFASRFGRNPDLAASPLIGRPAPETSMPYLEFADELSLTDLKGDIVVVNFWAAWCPGCRDEHDDLVAAAANYADIGVSIVGVLHQDQPQAGVRFLDEFGRGDPYRYVVDVDSRAGIDFGVLGLPTTFFLDREGTVVGQVNGPVDYSILARTLDAIVLGGDVDPFTETGELETR